MGEETSADILHKLTSLDLTEEEIKAVEVASDDEEAQELKFPAIAKVLTSRPVNHKVLVNNLGGVWRTSRSMTYKSVSNNLILFNFATSTDRQRVLDGGPWNYKNCPIIFREFDSLQRPSEMEFTLLPIWIRVYDLPLGLMNARTAKVIGGLFGEVMELDFNEDVLGWGEYLRVRVRMNISKPLRRGVLLKFQKSKNPNGEWFEVKYERLPFFCFHCGLVGNDLCGCGTDGGSDDKQPKYKESLRVPIASWGVEVEKMGKGSHRKNERMHPQEGEVKKTCTTDGEAGSAGGEGEPMGDNHAEGVARPSENREVVNVFTPKLGRSNVERSVQVKGKATNAAMVAGRGKENMGEGSVGEEDVGAVVLMEEDEAFDSTLWSKLNRKKRGRDVPTKMLTITCGGEVEEAEDGSIGGPQQKKKKESFPVLQNIDVNALSARAAKSQPRRAQ